MDGVEEQVRDATIQAEETSRRSRRGLCFAGCDPSILSWEFTWLLIDRPYMAHLSLTPALTARHHLV